MRIGKTFDAKRIEIESKPVVKTDSNARNGTAINPLYTIERKRE